MTGIEGRRVVAVDAGRTNSRAAVFRTGTGGAPVPVASATAPSAATLADPDGPVRVAATVRAVTGEVLAAAGPAGAAPRTLVVVAAGAVQGPALAALAAQLAGDDPAGDVLVACDVVAAHAAAFAGSPGVVLAGGTGAIALAVRADGRHAVVDGGGYLIGDAGGGFAIGRAGLAAAMRHVDGRPGGSATLATAAAARFGPLESVPAVLHGSADPARQVASFTPDVAAAAAADDPVALSIWQEAATELAGTVTAACTGLPRRDRRVALVGTLFDVELLTTRLRALLADQLPGAPVQVAAADALAGAAGLASISPEAYGSLVVRRASQ